MTNPDGHGELLREFDVQPDDAKLLDDAGEYVRRYVVLDDCQLDATVLWCAHTHAFDAAEMTPYLNITSPEKRCGKTRVLRTLRRLVARPWYTGRVTAAVLVRKVEAEKPTLLLDESDAAFKGEKEYAETLRGLLNSGFERDGVTSLCVGQGANIAYKDYSVFCPKAIAGIGKLPDTVEDRSITIIMKRKAKNERVEKFRERSAKALAEPICDGLERWATENIDRLRDARPALPDALDDRAQDVWEPLLAIADLAGGDWPKRARAAALALSTGDGREDDSLGVRLLRDVKAVFEPQSDDGTLMPPVERIPTANLLAALIAIDDAPWGDLRGRTLDGRGLARRQRPHGVKPSTIRVGDGPRDTAKGYKREDFADAWSRYLSPEQASQPSQPSQTLDSDSGNVTDVTANWYVHAGDDDGSPGGDGPSCCLDCGAFVEIDGELCEPCYRLALALAREPDRRVIISRRGAP